MDLFSKGLVIVSFFFFLRIFLYMAKSHSCILLTNNPDYDLCFCLCEKYIYYSNNTGVNLYVMAKPILKTYFSSVSYFLFVPG